MGRRSILCCNGMSDDCDAEPHARAAVCARPEASTIKSHLNRAMVADLTKENCRGEEEMMWALIVKRWVVNTSDYSWQGNLMITTLPSSVCLCKLKQHQQGSNLETAVTDYACINALCISEVDLKSWQVKFMPGNITLQVSMGNAGEK